MRSWPYSGRPVGAWRPLTGPASSTATSSGERSSTARDVHASRLRSSRSSQSLDEDKGSIADLGRHRSRRRATCPHRSREPWCDRHAVVHGARATVGAPVDERTDQFLVLRRLYKAVRVSSFSRKPYRGVRSTMAWRVAPRPHNRRCHRGAGRRCSPPSGPARDRYPSMDALLAALAPRRAGRRWQLPLPRSSPSS